MTPGLLAALAVAGGVGAGIRLVLDGAIDSWVRRRGWSRTWPGVPWALMVVNISGSLALGLVTAMAARSALPQDVLVVLGTGLLGGYTTFSTASFDTVVLLQERRYLAGFAVGVGTLVLGVGAAGLGLLLGGI